MGALESPGGLADSALVLVTVMAGVGFSISNMPPGDVMVAALGYTEYLGVDKMKVPVARILTWPWLAGSLHTCG